MEEPRPSEAEPGLKPEGLTSWSHKAFRQQPVKPSKVFQNLVYTPLYISTTVVACLKYSFLVPTPHPDNQNLLLWGPGNWILTVHHRCHPWNSCWKHLGYLGWSGLSSGRTCLFNWERTSVCRADLRALHFTNIPGAWPFWALLTQGCTLPAFPTVSVENDWAKPLESKCQPANLIH